VNEHATNLEEEVAKLKSSVELLYQRVEHLERGLPAAPTEGPAAPVDDQLALAAMPGEWNLRGVSALLGRTLLVFAGAFLLRALTDSQVVSRLVGAALGLAYAGIWMYLSDREGAKGAKVSSAIHGLTAVLIAFPLVWETTVRFHVWNPLVAALLLAGMTAGGFVVSWRRDLRPLAWVTGVGGSLTAAALLVSTQRVEPFTVLLVAIGLTTVWFSYLKKWFGVRWVTAALADLVVLQVSMLAARPGGPPETYASMSIPWAAGLGVALFLGYAGTFTVRTLFRRRNVTPFETTQMVASLAIGMGGAVRIARVTGTGVGVIGFLTLALGAAAYAVAFTAVSRRLGRGRNFILYSSLGVALVLAGSPVVTGWTVVPFVWAGLAVTTAVLGGRLDRVTLRSHSVIYSLAALAASGALRWVLDAFIAGFDTPWAQPTFRASLILAITGVCYLIVVWTRGLDPATWRHRLPRLVLGTLALSGFIAVLIAASRALGLAGSAGALAAVRTVLLSLTAVGTAVLGRSLRLRELGWLTYPLLVLCGVKVLSEDLRHGTPSTLFVGFAAYGLALLAAPRLQRQRDDTSAVSSPAAGS